MVFARDCIESILYTAFIVWVVSAARHKNSSNNNNKNLVQMAFNNKALYLII